MTVILERGGVPLGPGHVRIAGAARLELGEPVEVLVVQRNAERAEVFPAGRIDAGARDRYHVLALGEQPGQRYLVDVIDPAPVSAAARSRPLPRAGVTVLRKQAQAVLGRVLGDENDARPSSALEGKTERQ